MHQQRLAAGFSRPSKIAKRECPSPVLQALTPLQLVLIKLAPWATQLTMTECFTAATQDGYILYKQ